MFPEIFRDDVFRLETQHLWLRWPTARDESAIERFAGAPDVAAMTSRIPNPYPRGAAASFIYQARVGNAQGTSLTFALTPLTRPHEAIGMIDLRDEDGVPTLGYWLGRPYWGMGLMSEAVASLVGAAFQLAGCTAVASTARMDNPASRRVLEKAGFVQTGARRQYFPAREREFEIALYLRERDDGAAITRRGIGLSI
jgi:RimJ/RimL family protein N-acetyltransferase